LRRIINKNLLYYFKMDSIFIIAAVVSFVYLIFKFIEMRFVEKDSKPLKLLIKDSLFVYFSVLLGSFILDQIKPLRISDEIRSPQVFTGNPEF
jgi:hypothetical protein